MDINILKTFSMVENYLNIEIKSVKGLEFFATAWADRKSLSNLSKVVFVHQLNAFLGRKSSNQPHLPV